MNGWVWGGWADRVWRGLWDTSCGRRVIKRDKQLWKNGRAVYHNIVSRSFLGSFAPVNDKRPQWVDRWADGWVDGWADGWADGLVDGLVDRFGRGVRVAVVLNASYSLLLVKQQTKRVDEWWFVARH